MLVTLCLLLAAPPAVPADHARDMAASRALFASSVRKTLADACLKCHGGDKTRGGLDLSTRERLLKGGDNGPAAVVGKGASSKLVRLASHADEPFMPPGKEARLTKQQLADLARWIDLGAAYDKPLVDRPDKPVAGMTVTDADRAFWSFRPLARPAVPASAGGRNPVDAFLLDALRKKGLAFAPEADRRTLLRRAAFAVTGLPPTPEDIDRHLADTRPDAHERLVGSLLSSPAFGERWSRHWLDAVRFAESHGFEHDYDRPHAYTYRDFVIRAVNADLPWRDFIRFQLAGDELSPGDPLAMTATGFLGAGVHSTQITANTVEKERYDELDDIVRTMGTSMLGLTLGCARCHDHKYDPVPTRDYYRLVATFTKTIRADVDIDLDPESAKKARDEHAAKIAAARADLAAWEKANLPAKARAFLKTAKAEVSAWAVVVPTKAVSSGGATFVNQPDGSLLATGTSPDNDTHTFTLAVTGTEPIRALRLEALAHPSFVRGGPGRADNGNFALSDLRVTAQAGLGKPVPVKLVKPRATFEQRGLPVAATIDDNANSAWAVDPQFGKDQAAVFDFATPVTPEAGLTLTVTLRYNNNTRHSIGRPRLSLSAQTSPPVTAGDGVPADVRKILGSKGEPSAEEMAALIAWYRGRDAEWRKQAASVEALVKKTPTLGKTKAMICTENVPAVRLHTQGGDFLEATHFLKRGDPNQKDGIASQAFPQILTRTKDAEGRWKASPPAGARTPFLRAALADWITDVDAGAGHLLARVAVNRIWASHFGRGIVATPGDFGLQGDRPTHPELLDWLACELISSGWSAKHIHRLILTSAAWRQSGTVSDKATDADSENKLLWRMTPRRLEAEPIRDALLAVSGGLDRRMYGPGTLDESQPRRAVYFFVKRSRLNPMMTLFDAPDGTVGIDGRTPTTIAPQALLLMNNPVVRKAAEGFARRLPEGGAVEASYRLALGRSATAAEREAAEAFLSAQEAAHAKAGRSDARIRARADWCQVLLGLNEFVYVD